MVKKRAGGRNRQKQGIVSPNPKTAKGPVPRADRTGVRSLGTKARAGKPAARY